MRVLLKISPFNAMTGFENLHQVVCQNLYLCEETFKFDSSYLGEGETKPTDHYCDGCQGGVGVNDEFF